MGLAGLLIPLGPLASASTKKSQTFDDWRRAFEAGMPARMAAAKISGLAVAITSRDTSTHYETAFGYADLSQNRKFTADTPMHLASVSKLFTASALVQLFERLGHDLHADVNNFIDFPVTNPHHPDLPITPFQLLTHTSSISDVVYNAKVPPTPGDPKVSLSSFLRDYLVKGGKLYSASGSYSKAKPGAAFDYSDVGMALAGYVVQCVSEQDFATYTKTNLFDPLGINSAHWYLREFAPNVLAKPYEFKNGKFAEMAQKGYPDVPSGMLRCSVRDLAKMLHAMLGGDTGPNPILSPCAVAEMLRRQIDPSLVHYQGLGWVEEVINGHAYVGHSGLDDGATNMVALTDDQSHAVAVLINTDETDAVSNFRGAVTQDLVAGAALAG